MPTQQLPQQPQQPQQPQPDGRPTPRRSPRRALRFNENAEVYEFDPLRRIRLPQPAAEAEQEGGSPAMHTRSRGPAPEIPHVLPSAIETSAQTRRQIEEIHNIDQANRAGEDMDENFMEEY